MHIKNANLHDCNNNYFKRHLLTKGHLYIGGYTCPRSQRGLLFGGDKQQPEIRLRSQARGRGYM